MSEFAPVLNVSALDGSNGFRLDGDAVNDFSGRSVSGGGDVNGDGFADLLIGAPSSDTGGVDRGLAWVVFGAASSPPAQGLAARVAAGSAYRFQTESAFDRAGVSISNAGDVNGDGFDDFIIGAPNADPDYSLGGRGTAILVFGKLANLETLDAADGSNDNRIELANLTPATGYRFDGVANIDSSGSSVSGAGDVNGDGFADLLIGAPSANVSGGIDNGASYIVFGGAANLATLDAEDAEGVDGFIDLANISAGQGLRLDGATAFVSDQSGVSVALVGDVNGDGFDDALIGAPFADPNGTNTNEGAAYLVFGRAQSLFTLESLDLANIFDVGVTRFDGVVANDLAGRAVSGLGDVNGDGFADIVIGASSANSSGTLSGSAYVVFGKSAFGASSDLSALNGANGFRLDGLREFDRTGVSVSAAGDVNGDGFADILVGADGFDRLGAYNAGAVYVVFGKASGFAAVIDLGSLDGDSGFRIEGAAGSDLLGRGTTAAAGDVNGDGFDDIVVGAYYADNNALGNSGSTYIVYGHRAETAVTRLGTALNNTINGGKGDDSISGLSGNDTLIGWEGDDTINGGDGRDVINGGDDNDTISGGSGKDTIIASAGEDVIQGGSAKDTFDLSGFGSTAISINLASGSFLHFNGEDIQTFSKIENVIGTSGADTITGNIVKNSLSGGLGNDTLIGGANADILDGGIGDDTASYATANAGVIANLLIPTVNTGDAAGDTYVSIEWLAGSSFNDQLYGNNLVNRLAGGAGNDVLRGFLGNDLLWGQAGADIFLFNTTLNAATNVDRIMDFAVIDDTVYLENAIFTALGAAGALSAAAFAANATGLAGDASDRIIHENDTGKLFYDADGTGAIAGVQFAMLTVGLALTAADFQVI